MNASDLISRPFHGLVRQIPKPSDESLGYYQASAKADSAVFCKAVSDHQVIGH